MNGETGETRVWRRWCEEEEEVREKAVLSFDSESARTSRYEAASPSSRLLVLLLRRRWRRLLDSGLLGRGRPAAAEAEAAGAGREGLDEADEPLAAARLARAAVVLVKAMAASERRASLADRDGVDEAMDEYEAWLMCFRRASRREEESREDGVVMRREKKGRREGKRKREKGRGKKDETC
jgi:hypothetical protein